MGVVAVDLDRHFLTELLPSRSAVAALRAALIVMHHYTLTNARLACVDPRAQRDDDTARLMTGDDGIRIHGQSGRLRPTLRSPVLMQIAAAHPGRLHLDHDVLRPRRGVIELHQFELASARKHHALHGSLPGSCSTR
jgi:hypothetical protein